MEAKVDCPRCGQTLTVHEGDNEAECNCHLYCEDGEKISDCSLTPITVLNNEVGWPYGLHVNGNACEDDVTHIQYYCNAHNRYGYKTPILVPVDWDKWLSKRAPAKHRMMNI